jgi:hypothetical protein
VALVWATALLVAARFGAKLSGKLLNLVVPFPAEGPADFFSRTLAQLDGMIPLGADRITLGPSCWRARRRCCHTRQQWRA